MPSPFPGMDPYLEDAENWRDVHHWLISAIVDQLRPQIRLRGYVATIESRIWLEPADRSIYPDVSIRKSARKPIATAGVLVADPPIRVRKDGIEMTEDYIQVIEIGTRRLVTGIEIISPTNKSDHRAREMYIRKRDERAAADASLVEIDLLRGGRSLVALPVSEIETRASDDYLLNIVRAFSDEYEYYRVTIPESLPKIAIPLKPGDDDAVLDLQAAIARTYEAGDYEGRITYEGPPVPPLSFNNALWSESLLADKGFRPIHH